MTGAACFASSANRRIVRYGDGKIGSFMTGAIVRKDGVPAASKVEIYDQNTGLRIDGTTSNASGEWEIQNLDTSRRYFVRVHDPSGQLNGAVLDWLQPVPM